MAYIRALLVSIKEEFARLEQQFAIPEVISSPGYPELAQRYALLRKVNNLGQEWIRMSSSIAEEEELWETEEDLRDQIEDALTEDRARLSKLEHEIKKLLLPPDPNDVKSAIVEIRAGTGGDESSLFAADLFRMHTRYAEQKGFKVSLLDTHPTSLGGFKQVIFVVEGGGAYGYFRYESGVHRVQRVPETESSGRIHTSTATVAVFPEAKEVEVDINPKDLKIDTFHATGPGGQSVNTTDSAVRITHTPTGLTVSCQDEKSQHKNKAQAMRVLRARLKSLYEQEQEAKLSATRRKQIGSGERSEKIRTYNFPQNRVTDHRINLTIYRLEEILAGNLDLLIEQLREAIAEKVAL